MIQWWYYVIRKQTNATTKNKECFILIFSLKYKLCEQEVAFKAPVRPEKVPKTPLFPEFSHADYIHFPFGARIFQY